MISPVLSRYSITLLIVCTGLLFSACTNTFTQRYTLRSPEPVGEALRTDGFFYRTGVTKEQIGLDIMMIWPDGTAGKFVRTRWRNHDPRAPETVIQDMIDEFVRYLEVASLNPKKEGPPAWGAVAIDRDSIIVQQVVRYYGYTYGYSTLSSYGTVKSDSVFTVTRLVADVPDAAGPIALFNREETNVQRTYRFHPLDSMPSPNNWLKRRFATASDAR